MTACRFVTLKQLRKLIFHSGKYDASPFWRDAILQHKNSNQEILEVEERKFDIWIRVFIFFYFILKIWDTYMPVEYWMYVFLSWQVSFICFF
jgi:hypothetical protein